MDTGLVALLSSGCSSPRALYQGTRPLRLMGRTRLYGKRWPAIAEAIRERDGRRCTRCGMSEADNGRALDVHHILPVRTAVQRGDPHRPSNLRSLCRACHYWTETRRVQQGKQHLCQPQE